MGLKHCLSIYEWNGKRYAEAWILVKILNKRVLHSGREKKRFLRESRCGHSDLPKRLFNSNKFGSTTFWAFGHFGGVCF